MEDDRPRPMSNDPSDKQKKKKEKKIMNIKNYNLPFRPLKLIMALFLTN
jgi:hypothetical protein